MRSALRWRHWCEFCKRSMARRGDMARHEERCTLNPARVCGLCKLEKLRLTFDLADLRVIAANDDLLALRELYDDEALELAPTFKEVLERIDYEDECPVCVFSALRQTKKIEAAREAGWDYKARMEEFWKERARKDYEAEMAAVYY